jgi:hypothetical protein
VDGRLTGSGRIGPNEAAPAAIGTSRSCQLSTDRPTTTEISAEPDKVYVAEDGLEVPPAPEGYGPRRLMRYRRAYLARLRGEAPAPETQGVPVVPVIAPEAGALRLQQRFAALAEKGRIETLPAQEEFERFLAADGSALPFREEGRLDDVRRQILGDGGLTAAQPVSTINPAHLSGFSSADIQTTTYDENLLGPMTMSVPIVFGGRKDDAGGAGGAAEGSAGSAEGALGAVEPEAGASGAGRTPAAEGTPVSEGVPAAGGASAEAPETAETSGNGSSASTPDDVAETASPAPPEAGDASGPAAQGSIAPETVSAQPVSAMDAHGLDLDGLDRKAPGNGGKIALWTVVLLVIVAAVVLGIVFFMP